MFYLSNIIPSDTSQLPQFLVPYFWTGGVALALLLAWSVIWKGIALWKAARNGHKIWFFVLLILNTVGILEILYIFIWGKKKSGVSPPPSV
ncbi:MAG: DUF5652 family protein [bacterium]